MNVLVAVLTSFDAKRARRAVESCLCQRDFKFRYHPYVFVNSLDPGYPETVKAAIDGRAPIVHTRSNGMPGMGKQSVINYMMAHEKFDAMILIDGDDFLYPTAFKVIEHVYNEHGVDVLGLQANDMMFDHDVPYQEHFIDDDIRLTGWWGNQRNHCADRFDGLTSISVMRTPDRIVWMTRKAHQAGSRPWFPTDMWVHEDYVASVSCLLGHHYGEYRYSHSGTGAIYVHDGTKRTSTCSTYFDAGKTWDDSRPEILKRIGWMARALGPFSFNTVDWLRVPTELDVELDAEAKVEFIRGMMDYVK